MPSHIADVAAVINKMAQQLSASCAAWKPRMPKSIEAASRLANRNHRVSKPPARPNLGELPSDWRRNRHHHGVMYRTLSVLTNRE